MDARQYTSSATDRYILRFHSHGLREQIKELARESHRTLNGQLLHLIELGLKVEMAAKQEQQQ